MVWVLMIIDEAERDENIEEGEGMAGRLGVSLKAIVHTSHYILQVKV
jgi:hypothetical protein